MCVLKIIKMEKENTNKREKKSFQMIIWPEHAEDISCVYVVNQIYESVSDLFEKQNIGKDRALPMALFVCVFLPVLLIKRLHIAVYQ